jgi:CheY-like chemotaxis protein
MNGDIRVESQPGLGSVFTVNLPFEVIETVPPPSAPRPVLSPRRVLVVDDNPTVLAVIGEMLKGMGFTTVAVDSGEAALARLRAAQAHKDTAFDLVLLDWQMPGMDGVETARVIRRAPWPHIPKLLLMTAYRREEAQVAAQQSGIDGVIPKTLQPSDLCDAILSALGMREFTVDRPPERQGGVALAGLRILLAEDNEINQQVMVEILGKFGVTVKVVPDGLAAVEALRAGGFDLVLMDVQMPVMDGLAATRAIRALEQPWAKTIPVLAMTAHAMAEDVRRSLAAGMNDHITKPVDPHVLIAMLRQWASRPR